MNMMIVYTEKVWSDREVKKHIQTYTPTNCDYPADCTSTDGTTATDAYCKCGTENICRSGQICYNSICYNKCTDGGSGANCKC